jgi:hypothetical protein
MSMNAERAKQIIERWSTTRALGMWRVVLLFGGWMTGWMFVVYTFVDFLDAGPGGLHLQLGDLIRTLVKSVAVGAFVGLFVWLQGNRRARRARAFLETEATGDGPARVA